MRLTAQSGATALLLAVLSVGVCSGQTQNLFGASPGAARVISLTGNVTIFKDGYPWAVVPNQWIQPRQEVATGADGHAIFQLADGSTFELFPNSRATFRANAGGLTELLDLWMGRVRVHIQKLNGKPNPNRVLTPTAVISVRGTVFDVTVEEEDVTLVLVEEGQVAVQHVSMPYTEPKLLNAGDYVRVYKNMPLAGRRLDRGMLWQRVLSAFTDTLLYRTPRTPTTGPGGVPAPAPPPTAPPVGLPGDVEGGGPGVPPPPPPPPPPGE